MTARKDSSAPARRDDSRTLIVERQLPHPPEKVWRVLTQSALMDEWLMPNDFQARVGHRFTLRAAPAPHWDGIVECEVLTVDQATCLSYSWNTSGGLRTVVTWTLSPTTDGTRLRMEQSGFRAAEEANFRGAKFGWQKFIRKLETVLERL